MTATTVVTDDSATTIISEPDPITVEPFKHRISWSAVFSGALVSTAVIFFLLALGSGFGLSLVSARHATADGTVTFLTLGAVYFFAAQAFGFAAGGHIAGRLMGPVLETRAEEEFLAGSHGLITWALAVVVTAAMIYLAALATGSAAIGGAALGTTAGSPTATPAMTGYWVDRLFRAPPQAMHAALGWHSYAQVDDGTATDATTDAPAAPAVSGQMLQPSDTPPPAVSNPPPRTGTMMTPSSTVMTNPDAPMIDPVPTSIGPHNIAADKAEAARILEVGMADGQLSEIDRAQLAQLVAMDTGQTEDGAMRRVENTEKQMHEAQLKAAETARKIAAFTSLWTALALLFGSVVAVMSSISARWEDDRVTFGFLNRAS